MNRIEIRGRIGQEPRITRGDMGAVARFSVATSEIYKNRQGDLKEETLWHNVVAWEGSPMEKIPEIHKGNLVEVTGKLRLNRYVNSAGEDRISYDLVASRITVCDPNTGEALKQ